jgi:hypothetical protein
MTGSSPVTCRSRQAAGEPAHARRRPVRTFALILASARRRPVRLFASIPAPSTGPTLRLSIPAPCGLHAPRQRPPSTGATLRLDPRAMRPTRHASRPIVLIAASAAYALSKTTSASGCPPDDSKGAQDLTFFIKGVSYLRKKSRTEFTA